MNLHDLREAAKTTIATTGLRGTPYTPDQINPPSFWVANATINYQDVLGGGTAKVTMSVVVALSSAEAQRSEQTLDDYLSTDGARSIYAAVEADPTLGGACDSAALLTMDETGVVEIAGQQYIGAKCTLEVFA